MNDDFEAGRRYERIRGTIIGVSHRMDELDAGAVLESSYALVAVSVSELEKYGKTYYPKGDTLHNSTIVSGRDTLRLLEKKMSPELLAKAKRKVEAAIAGDATAFAAG